MTARKVKNELKGLIISKNKTNSELAEKLDMKYPTFIKKLNGHIQFTTNDIEILKKELSIPDSKVYQYFF